MAVVPAWLTEGGRARILACRGATVLQHGWAHDDHAPAGRKRLELGGEVDRGRLLADMARGRAILEAAFDDRFLSVMVPPWNRIDADIVPHLAPAGYVGLSTFGAAAGQVNGMARIDTHVDLVDWRRGRSYPGDDAIAARIIDRLGRTDHGTVGILSHHRAMDEAGWAGLARLLNCFLSCTNVRLPNGRELFQV
ncbi:hypothetical protein [Marinivivus vitaminiproducens]|uniref:hypothetical protein n=1 Tax=Marinivivus vitaminiproducens TaxID=3035935 RepID=UPI003F9F0935